MDDLDLGATIRGFSSGQKVFNRYVLVRQLGRGGMGVVWLARDESLEREVAIKMLPEIVANDPVAVKELKRETARSQRLSHPRILRIYDFVESGPLCGITMEYVEGGTLAANRLEQPGEVFSPAALGKWVRQLCEALAYAHSEVQIVHRDLKPANLMIDRAGDLKVADFGIAASVSDSVSRVSHQASSSGTPVYMSPQQMMGDKPAVTDDLYALGATLYELLTGKPPFYSGNVILQVQSKMPPSMTARRSEFGVMGEPIPAAWEATIAACLAKSPSDRPQSAAEVAERLGLTNNNAPSFGQTAADNQNTNTASKVERPVPQSIRTQQAESLSGGGRSTVTARLFSTGRALRLGLISVLIFSVTSFVYWLVLIAMPEERKNAAFRQRIVAMDAEQEQLRQQRLAAEIEAEKGRVERARSAQATMPEKRLIIPDLNLEMVPIPAGSFMMGNVGGSYTESPKTQVKISRPYWLAKTEVTQMQWTALMGSNPSKFRGLDLPVEQVSWDEVMEYCRKLTERERVAGRLPAGYIYSLPTEAQWEYACRAGTTGDYGGTGRSDDMGWSERNSGGSTKPVGAKQANAWGLHDMHGNVWEWCLDRYVDRHPGGSVTDPTGPPAGSLRVFRGGSWVTYHAFCTSTRREREKPDYRNPNLGFRLALTPLK